MPLSARVVQYVGINPRAYGLDVVGLILGVVAGVVLGKTLMKMQYESENRERLEDGERSSVERKSSGKGRGAKDGDQSNADGTKGQSRGEGDTDDSDGGRDAGVMLQYGSTIVTSTLLIGYPVGILPYYRAESTSDWERFAIVCLVHPFAQEFILTAQRQMRRIEFIKSGHDLEDPDAEHNALQSVSMPGEKT